MSSNEKSSLLSTLWGPEPFNHINMITFVFFIIHTINVA